MLHAPTSETKQRSSQSKANQEPQPEHQLHQRLGVTATQGWASGDGSEWAPTPDSARGRDRVIVHGVNANFVIKYPMMFVGGLTVMVGFVLAYRSQEQRALSNGSVMEPSFGD